MRKRFSLPVALAAGALALAGPAQATPVSRYVDDNHVQCPTAAYTTIQAAVNASNAGDYVRVCDGTYNEQVTIPAGKNGIKVFAVHNGAATIQNPTTASSGAIVDIRSRSVLLRGFVIQGPFNTVGCGGDVYGVRVIGGASATIDFNHITKIQAADPALGGCQFGVGVLIGRKALNTTGQATVSQNTIDEYQKGGVVVDGPGSSGVVERNTINGGGDNPIIARNGVQLGRSATGRISRNTIDDNSYSGPGGRQATGVLLFEVSGNVLVNSNTVHRNDYGIDLDVGSFGTRSARISANVVRDSFVDGIGVFTAGSTGNNLDSNSSLGSGGRDCVDETTGTRTAGTANTWSNDTGNTQSPAGICKPTAP